MIPGDTSVVNASREEDLADHRVGMCPHDYDVALNECTVVRWCTNCGKTWMLQKRLPGELFSTEWERIWENG